MQGSNMIQKLIADAMIKNATSFLQYQMPILKAKGKIKFHFN